MTPASMVFTNKISYLNFIVRITPVVGIYLPIFHIKEKRPGSVKR